MSSEDCPTFNCCLGRERCREEDDERFLLGDWCDDALGCKEEGGGTGGTGTTSTGRRPSVLLNLRGEAGARVFKGRPDGKLQVSSYADYGGSSSGARTPPRPGSITAAATQRGRLLSAMDVIAANEGLPWWDDSAWAAAPAIDDEEDLFQGALCDGDAEEAAAASGNERWKWEPHMEEEPPPDASCLTPAGIGATPPRASDKQSAARRAAIALLTPISVDSVLSPGLVGSQKSTAEPLLTDDRHETRQRYKQVALLTPMSVDTAVQSPAHARRHSPFQAVELRTPESIFTEHVGAMTAMDARDWPESDDDAGDVRESDFLLSVGHSASTMRLPRPGVVTRLLFQDEAL